MKKALVLGAGGFIGSHLVRRLKSEGYWVRGVDLKYPEFWGTKADDFVKADLRDPQIVENVFRLEVDPRVESIIYKYAYYKQPFTEITTFDEVYQLAADMGGVGFMSTGQNDVDILSNSVRINLNVLEQAVKFKPKKIFFASSACVYNEDFQKDPKSKDIYLKEEYAYPSQPDSEYGWEKLFSERLYQTYEKENDFKCYIGRFHGIFGPYGTYRGGREKAPAALCRKAVEAEQNGDIEIWGDGEQIRSFLYIDEAIEAVRRFIACKDFTGPVNIGSSFEIEINGIASMLSYISGKNLNKIHVPGPEGVRGRSSDNTLIREKLGGWEPGEEEGHLMDGLEKTYKWIQEEESNRKLE